MKPFAVAAGCLLGGMAIGAIFDYLSHGAWRNYFALLVCTGAFFYIQDKLFK